MVLESTMICFDNSNYMRNEDYVPSRLTAQIDCVNLICMSKLRAHPQNDIGLMTISNQVQVLSTLTNVIGCIYKKLNLIQPEGDLNFITGIRIAHLVLKNRQQKDHKMRIIVFVGSPLTVKQEQLVQLAKKFKKEKVHVDVVNFGEYAENEPKLLEFIKTLNGTEELNENSSRLLTVPRGGELSEVLRASPILALEASDSSGNVNNAGNGFGFDLDDDPDLALALRISLEEQRALEAEQERRRMLENNDVDMMLAEDVPDEEPARQSGPRTIDNMSEEELIAYVLQLSSEEANAEKNNVNNNTNNKDNQ